MTIHVLLADGEPLVLERLNRLFRGMPDVVVVAKAGSGPEALELIAAHKPDLALMDVRMPSGLAIATQLAAQPGAAIVFTSISTEFALQAFDAGAVDYLLKPVARARLAQTLARVRQRTVPRDTTCRDVVPKPVPYPNFLNLKVGRDLQRLPVGEIRWLQAAGDDVIVHTAHARVRSRVSLATLAAKLDPKIMIQVSRSAIVNRQAVTAIQTAPRGGLRLRIGDDLVVRVGQTFRNVVRRTLGLRQRSVRGTRPELRSQ